MSDEYKENGESVQYAILYSSLRTVPGFKFVDLAHSLSSVYQMQQLEVCPSLKQSIDNPNEIIYCIFSRHRINKTKCRNVEPENLQISLLQKAQKVRGT